MYVSACIISHAYDASTQPSQLTPSCSVCANGACNDRFHIVLLCTVVHVHSVEHTRCCSTALLAVIARALVWTPFLLFVLNQKTQGRGTAWLFSSRCRLPSPSLSILACSTSCTCTATLNTDVGTEKGIIKDPCTSTAVKGGLLR